VKRAGAHPVPHPTRVLALPKRKVVSPAPPVNRAPTSLATRTNLDSPISRAYPAGGAAGAVVLAIPPVLGRVHPLKLAGRLHGASLCLRVPLLPSLGHLNLALPPTSRARLQIRRHQTLPIPLSRAAHPTRGPRRLRPLNSSNNPPVPIKVATLMALVTAPGTAGAGPAALARRAPQARSPPRLLGLRPGAPPALPAHPSQEALAPLVSPFSLASLPNLGRPLPRTRLVNSASRVTLVNLETRRDPATNLPPRLNLVDN
jgi:hypothetical protein